MSRTPDRYLEAGVDYATLDAAKRLAQVAARETSPYASRRGAAIEDASRGESATVVRIGEMTLGFVLECLGTKSMIARAYEEQTGVDRFAAIGYDTVAAIVNDCCCVGALPVVVNAYFATGASSWYEGTRNTSLVSGFARACADAGASWGGGESPTLSGLVTDREIDLAGSAIGVVPDGGRAILGEGLTAGDDIVLVASSGLHANGASLARQIASDLEDRYATGLPSGRELGDALLEESVIYVSLVEALLTESVELHYASHITGHGLRKLMRAHRELTYRIDSLPPVPEVLSFLVERALLSPRDAYGTLNMGAGFALYVPGGAGQRVVAIASELGYQAIVSGAIEKGPRRVVLSELGVEYAGNELELR